MLLEARSQHLNTVIVHSGNCSSAQSTEHYRVTGRIPIRASLPPHLRLQRPEYTTHCYTWQAHTKEPATEFALLFELITDMTIHNKLHWDKPKLHYMWLSLSIAFVARKNCNPWMHWWQACIPTRCRWGDPMTRHPYRYWLACNEQVVNVTDNWTMWLNFK